MRTATASAPNRKFLQSLRNSQDRLFLNTPSDATLLPAVLTAAEDALADGPFSADAPGDDEMRADVESLAIAPLFDGSALERI